MKDFVREWEELLEIFTRGEFEMTLWDFLSNDESIKRREESADKKSMSELDGKYDTGTGTIYGEYDAGSWEHEGGIFDIASVGTRCRMRDLPYEMVKMTSYRAGNIYEELLYEMKALKKDTDRQNDTLMWHEIVNVKAEEMEEKEAFLMNVALREDLLPLYGEGAEEFQKDKEYADEKYDVLKRVVAAKADFLSDIYDKEEISYGVAVNDMASGREFYEAEKFWGELEGRYGDKKNENTAAEEEKIQLVSVPEGYEALIGYDKEDGVFTAESLDIYKEENLQKKTDFYEHGRINDPVRLEMSKAYEMNMPGAYRVEKSIKERMLGKPDDEDHEAWRENISYEIMERKSSAEEFDIDRTIDMLTERLCDIMAKSSDGFYI